MKVRMKGGKQTAIRTRKDGFGGVCYVPHRDDFFAVDTPTFAAILRIGTEWRQLRDEEVGTFEALARLGICELDPPTTSEIAYSGPSFLGEFQEIPTVTEPLVLNCFCTAHCPLRCRYCHADDLMQEFRESEDQSDLDMVISTANMIPAIVAVITGGDPLTRPDRARYLIERLSKQKAVVIDTSGVGDIGGLIPTIRDNDVHVRVSLDAISATNDKIRPPNTKYVKGADASRTGATGTIDACVAAGIPVTVQTVICSMNENFDTLLQMRDWLVSRGVRNWVLHVAVRAGSARRVEAVAEKQHTRRRGILPGIQVYSHLWRLVDRTMQDQSPIDIRCTDTDTTPNSVLLVGSKGDLYTEGYAHVGKVPLYRAGEARPDLVRALWAHVDRFGHAKRYLNWNRWFFGGKSLERICYPVPRIAAEQDASPNAVETEAKYKVASLERLQELLLEQGFQPSKVSPQRDEYFDNSNRALTSLDYVVRLRIDANQVYIALKGPRGYTGMGESSRIELEFPAGELSAVRASLARVGLEKTWYFEKRRTTYKHERISVEVLIDEVPEIGYYAEFEGPIDLVRRTAVALSDGLASLESRNYRDVYVAYKISAGVAESDVFGAEFTSAESADAVTELVVAK